MTPSIGRIAGERVTFSVDVGSPQFFDPQTGLALEEVGA